MVQRGLDLLREQVCQSALHNSKERAHLPRRHPGTRVQLINDIMAWLDNVDDPHPILWMEGSTGFGKSVIAEAIARLCYEEGRLLGAYFVTEVIAAHTGSAWDDEIKIPPTIAHQMEQNRRLGLSRIIGGVVEDNPLIFGLNLPTQVEKLVIEPLSLRSDEMANKVPPALIILDGLGGFPNKSSQTQVVEAFSKAVLQAQHQIPVKLLITSRPAHGMHSIHIAPFVRTISLDNEYPAHADIRTFLIESIRDFRRTHSSSQMFTPEDEVDELVKQSRGRFAYAASIVTYSQRVSIVINGEFVFSTVWCGMGGFFFFFLKN
ncbi:hypothetical protein BDN70DRAFT_869577 [Pholiota conissans]|uniref:Nephrocystin 3-like N-terminal domain-containing protein n=1 Tax=Pholiota conissans TaxID=109636 RepID=A0A9P6CSK4_9AGAR|nr:hypothetical protein BDN70DRAFT_869577 [Pholiota conissans]